MWSNFTQYFLPNHCLLCGQRDGDGLCPACRASLPRPAHACPRCALPLQAATALCGRCLRQPPPLDSCHSLGLYQAPMDFLIQRMKFHQDLRALRLLADLLVQSLAQADKPALLLAVPLHRQRLAWRGYNQALELALAVGRRLNLPVNRHDLRRLRAGAAQSELPANERRANVRGAFALSAGFRPPEHVALVDDVMTTGHTLWEAARVLKKAGVQRVDAWLLARALPPTG